MSLGLVGRVGASRGDLASGQAEGPCLLSRPITGISYQKKNEATTD